MEYDNNHMYRFDLQKPLELIFICNNIYIETLYIKF